MLIVVLVMMIIVNGDGDGKNEDSDEDEEPQCVTVEDLWTGTEVITFYFSITREEYLYIATGSFRKTVVFYSPVMHGSIRLF